MIRSWIRQQMLADRLIHENGKLYRFHFLFPGNKKGYVQIPGNWISNSWKMTIDLKGVNNDRSSDNTEKPKGTEIEVSSIRYSDDSK